MTEISRDPRSLIAAFAEPTRLDILRLLRKGDLSAGEIGAHFPQARSTLSQHLKTLRDAGLVRTRRDGTRIVYSANVVAMARVVRLVRGLGRR